MSILPPEQAQSILRAYCTTREAAAILGVSLRTVQMWSNSGLLEVWKTQGGHRRVSRASVERLVVRRPPKAGDAAPPVTSAGTASREQGRLLRILVAEDDPILLDTYRVNLADCPGCAALATAENGYEALLLIGRSVPDLLVLDLHMPEFDGFQVLATLRKMHDFDAMHIVVVTGLSAEEITLRGGIPADIPVLTKPVDYDRLRAVIAKLAKTNVRRAA